MRALLNRFVNRIHRPRPIDQLPPAWLELLQGRRASALHASLKEAANRGEAIPTEALLEQAHLAGWDHSELDKLAAYCEFHSGQTATAYQRVMSHGLARTDYQLFMTACVHCYLYARFMEGYALLKQFEPDDAEQLNRHEFLAYAGYIAFAGGGKIEEATGYFDQALDQGLVSPLLAVNAYLIYFEAGRHERVDQIRRLIVEHYADDPEALFALGCVELSRDYYPEGFRLMEARYDMPEVSRSINNSLLARARWKDQPLLGKRLLIHGEQGFGDIVMMARYFPQLTAMGAKVVVDCREAAIPLLQYNFPDCEIVTGDLKRPVTVQFDLWTGVMSLPFQVNTTFDSVPARAGYLSAPPEQRAYWNDRVADLANGEGVRVGIAWSGNPEHRADKRRSVAFERIEPYLQEIPGVHFFALQTTVPATHPANLIDLSEELVTLADTAALIESMDLVITVDTSVVHMAGALGKPTWLLLPHRYEWRWGLEGENNAWYESVHVLRQERHGDWEGLLDTVFKTRLAHWLAERP